MSFKALQRPMMDCTGLVASRLRGYQLVRGPMGRSSSSRSMVDFTGLSSRVRDYEPARGEKGRSGGRSGLKVVVENRNIYEGQHMRVEHVVPDVAVVTSPLKPVARALPAWMGGGGRRKAEEDATMRAATLSRLQLDAKACPLPICGPKKSDRSPIL